MVFFVVDVGVQQLVADDGPRLVDEAAVGQVLGDVDPAAGVVRQQRRDRVVLRGGAQQQRLALRRLDAFRERLQLERVSEETQTLVVGGKAAHEIGDVGEHGEIARQQLHLRGFEEGDADVVHVVGR
jgi:hypothetical protein